MQALEYLSKQVSNHVKMVESGVVEKVLAMCALADDSFKRSGVAVLANLSSNASIHPELKVRWTGCPRLRLCIDGVTAAVLLSCVRV